MNNKKVLENEEIKYNKKLTYDDILKSKSAITDYQNKKANIPVLKVVSLSVVILAIVIGSLILLRVI